MKKIIENARNQERLVMATEKLLVRFRSAYLRTSRQVMTRTMIASVVGIHTYMLISNKLLFIIIL